MAQSISGGGLNEAPSVPVITRADQVRFVAGVGVIIALIAGAFALHNTPNMGAKASLSLLIGVSLGIVFERGRFCFFCILRDFIEYRNSSGLYAILAALAVGSVGYALVFGTFLPNAFSGRLPPDAHIGPASWVVVAAGVVFGVGMALSGACISGHLYRLGQGYSRAPFALVGSLFGFGLGFLSWQRIYIDTLIDAPVAWLPATLGYGGALALQLAMLAFLAVLLLRYVPAFAASSGGQLTLAGIYDRVVRQRWNPLVTGAIVGLIGAAAYFRVEPLGVTSQLSSMTRTFMAGQGMLADRLNGLDTFAGCAAVVAQTITNNGWLIGGLVAGSFAVSLAAKRFQWSALTLRGAVTAFGGGVAMGWGSMLALGCTVGTLLSGISAFAVSGWLFGAAVFLGVWLGIRLRLHRLD
jgi:uncharacterized membrane protein YedE/YeeE